MNFLLRIKEALYDPRRQHGAREHVAVVDRRSLEMLIDAFERLDSDMRSDHNYPMVSLDQRLYEAIIAKYHEQGKDSDATMAIIMRTLLPLIEEKYKSRQMRSRIGVDGSFKL